MKVAIFENEYESVRGAFETSNFLSFDSKLEFSIFPSSQAADFSQIGQFAAIFIDVDLSSKSDKDGFGVIRQIEAVDSSLLSKVIILTGNNNIENILKSMQIPVSIKTIIKPTNYEEIASSIKSVC